MATELKDKTEILLNSLLRIKEATNIAFIDSDIRVSQLNRIDNIIKKYTEHQLELNNIYILIKEDFGGSFGLLTESSPLLKELRNHSEIVNETKIALEAEILNKYITNLEFCSQPLIKYIERHGGPLWFDLEQIKINFLMDKLLEIKYDRSLSKTMSPNQNPIKTEHGTYRIVIATPNFIMGKIEMSDGRSYNFETLKNMDFLFLEHTQTLNESIVIERVAKT